MYVEGVVRITQSIVPEVVAAVPVMRRQICLWNWLIHDVPTMFRQVTKWNAEVVTPDIVAEAVRKAFKVAQTDKPGPTHIEFPEDVAGAPVEHLDRARPLRVQSPAMPEPLPAQINRAAGGARAGADPETAGLSVGRAVVQSGRAAESRDENQAAPAP